MILAEINVVPFLDILLILLIIFMMIPSQVLQGFEVHLPNNITTTNGINNNKSVLSIEIIETGLYNVTLNKKCIKNIHFNQLDLEIHRIVFKCPEILCLIAATKNVEYGAVIKVLNLLKAIGIHSVGIIT